MSTHHSTALMLQPGVRLKRVQAALTSLSALLCHGPPLCQLNFFQLAERHVEHWGNTSRWDEGRRSAAHLAGREKGKLRGEWKRAQVVHPEPSNREHLWLGIQIWKWHMMPSSDGKKSGLRLLIARFWPIPDPKSHPWGCSFNSHFVTILLDIISKSCYAGLKQNVTKCNENRIYI